MVGGSLHLWIRMLRIRILEYDWLVESWKYYFSYI